MVSCGDRLGKPWMITVQVMLLHMRSQLDHGREVIVDTHKKTGRQGRPVSWKPAAKD
jgi:hypothetical protein